MQFLESLSNVLLKRLVPTAIINSDRYNIAKSIQQRITFLETFSFNPTFLYISHFKLDPKLTEVKLDKN